jgi:hypothetical protein
LLAGLAAACRTGPLEPGETTGFGDLAQHTDGPSGPDDATYDARVLPTNLLRVVVFKRSSSENVCAWLILVASPNVNEHFTAPPGWLLESAAMVPYRADCFTIEPPTSASWPADATGEVSFRSQREIQPCALDMDATMVADLTANMLPRPADIAAQTAFDFKNLTVDGACP